MSRPISRVLSRAIIHLDTESLLYSSDLPDLNAGHVREQRSLKILFDLAPRGVYPATAVTSGAVRSYRTISPLSLTRRYRFCGTVRQFTLPSYSLARYPMEPGLSSPHWVAERLPSQLPNSILKNKGKRLDRIQRSTRHRSTVMRSV